ncbi:MAG: TetR/AcrR family transcriptional regulator [Halanaeroarchaeum sp.]
MDDDPATEILEATYRALCEHGYADLTMKDIAAESERSKAAIHYHYDSKENLFVEFLDYLFERYTDHLTAAEDGRPRDRLFELLEVVLGETEAKPGQEFRTAMLEVKAQAPYAPAIRERLERFDEYLLDHVTETVEAGVEAGEFDESVEPGDAAEFLVTAITGAHTRRVTVDRSTEELANLLQGYIERTLLVDEKSEDAD